MVKCDYCDKETDDWKYAVSYPLPISKCQEMRGVVPSGDKLLRLCKNCHIPESKFHNPEM